MKQLVIYSVIIIFTLTSCQKCKTDKNTPKYTISGRMMQNCTIPYANQTVRLDQEVATTGNSGGILVTGSTDSNGNFSLEYIPENSGSIILRNSNDDVITKIPIEQTINLGEIYINTYSNFVFKLQVNNSYTSLDTLFYTNYVFPITTNAKKIAGPFQNMTLDSIKNFPLSGPFNYGSNFKALSIRYYIKGQPYKDVDFNVNLCDNNYKIVVLTID